MRVAVSLLGLTAACLAGCTVGPSPDSGPEGEHAAQERRWEDVGLESYSFAFQQQCFCVLEQVRPVSIEVRDGRIARVLSTDTGQDLSSEPNLRWYTIPDLFDLISEAQEVGAEPFTVRYDPQLGYPTHIEIGSLAADAGVVYSVSDLQPL